MLGVDDDSDELKQKVRSQSTIESRICLAVCPNWRSTTEIFYTNTFYLASGAIHSGNGSFLK
jgi:hypothetical protein